MNIPKISFSTFLMVFAPVVVTLLLVGVVVAHVHIRGEVTTRDAREDATLELAARLVLRELDEIASDARLFGQGIVLAETAPIKMTEHAGHHLHKHYLAFVRTSARYEKIRFISKTGKELVVLKRNDRGYENQPASTLSDVSNETGFQETLSIGKGGIHISPVIWNSADDPPPSKDGTVIRVGIPVFDHTHKILGAVTLDIGVTEFLRDITSLLQNSGGLSMVLDGDGNWILGDGQPFSRQFPEVWSQISSRSAGILETDNYRFHFKAIQPFLISRTLVENSDQPGALDRLPAALINYKIIFVSKMDSGLLTLLTPDEQLATATAAAVLLIFTVIVSVVVAWFHQARKHSDIVRHIAEKRQRLILETAGDGIFGLSPNGRVEFANTAAEQLTGWRASELEGRFWHTLLHRDCEDDPLSPAVGTAGLGAISGDGSPRTADDNFIRKDGSILPVAYTTTSITPDTGMEGAVMVFRDITDRQEFEKQLKGAKEDAEAANDAKSIFLSSMSHELRTPLNSILGFGQVMQSNRREPLSDQQSESLGMIMKSGRHLLDLINRILDLSQIELGKISISLGAVSVSEVLEECVLSIQAAADERRISIKVTEPESGPRAVQADYLRLKQVLLNLVWNAVKFNRDAGVIELAFNPVANNLIRISVADTGFGIPVNRQSELFKSFNRLGADSTDTEGAGIGLIIAKQLTERMNGRLGFESTEGKGSVFWIELPVAESADYEVGV